MTGILTISLLQATRRVHFKNQRALIVREEGDFIEIKGLRFREAINNCLERRQSHPSDTDSRRLTAMNRG